MRNVFFITLFLCCCLFANGQNYLQEGNACFDKGDYECAKRNYNLFQTFDGRDMSAQIQKSDECFRALIVADGFFKDGQWDKARELYRMVLEKNPKDPHAKKQYDLCEEQLKPKEEMVAGETGEKKPPEKDNFIQEDNQQITIAKDSVRPVENFNVPVQAETKPDNLQIRKESTGSRPGSPLVIVGGVSIAAGIGATILLTKPYTEDGYDKIIRGKEYNLVYAAAGIVVGGFCIGRGVYLNRKARTQAKNIDYGYNNSGLTSHNDSQVFLNLVAYGNTAGLRLTF